MSGYAKFPQELVQRFQRLRSRVGKIRPTQYDITASCNLRCEGCLFFAGEDLENHAELSDLVEIDRFFGEEQRRGINYVQIGGAEPALAQEKLSIAAKYIPRGVVFSNGTVFIDSAIPYRIHISVWGLPEESRRFRGADTVRKSMRLYRGDKRAVFVFTINAQNMESIPHMVELCQAHGIPLVFSHFSPTTKYLEDLHAGAPPDRQKFVRLTDPASRMALSRADLERIRVLVDQAIERSPETVIYSHDFNDWINAPQGLYEVDENSGVALNCGSKCTSAYRHYRADFIAANDVKCCAPNIDCRHCRLYAQSLATALHRFPDFSATESGFRRWLGFWELWCRIFLVDFRPEAGQVDVHEDSGGVCSEIE